MRTGETSLPGIREEIPSRERAETGGGGLCLVLGAGGFRGLAHAGVLKALGQAGVRIRSIIGSSIGGLVALYYAGLGIGPERIAQGFIEAGASSLLAAGLALRGWGDPVSRNARDRARPILEGLARLVEIRSGVLHYGIERVGVLALDLPTGEEIFASTGSPSRVPLPELARGGASLPLLFPSVKVVTANRTFRLVDGGLSRSVPVERGFAPPFSADTVLAVDLRVRRGFRELGATRWDRLVREHGDALIRLRLPVQGTGTVTLGRGEGQALVRIGEAAVDSKILDRLGRR